MMSNYGYQKKKKSVPVIFKPLCIFYTVGMYVCMLTELVVITERTNRWQQLVMGGIDISVNFSVSIFVNNLPLYISTAPCNVFSNFQLPVRAKILGCENLPPPQHTQLQKPVRAKLSLCKIIKKKVKVTLVQALRLCTGRTAYRGSRGIALPFHDHGTRRG